MSELSAISREANIADIAAYEVKLRDELNARNDEGLEHVYPHPVRTKYCACRSNLDDDCRYHSREEPGWQVCPEVSHSSQIGNLKKGRWLYITTGEPVSQVDPTEAQDAALAEKLSNELIKAVQ